MLEVSLEIPLSLLKVNRDISAWIHFTCPLSLSVFADVPSNELLLIADVLVVGRIFHDVGNIHDKVHKCLCLLAKEVQQVAEAAVLSDHKHWT